MRFYLFNPCVRCLSLSFRIYDVWFQLTGFRIKYKTKQRGGKTTTLVIEDPSVRERVIDGLESNQHYQMRIAAVNQVR